MTTNSNFTETDVVRDLGGKFDRREHLAPEATLTATIDDGVRARTWNDWLDTELVITADPDGDDETFLAYGDDGVVTFRASPGSTAEELLEEAAEFYFDDEFDGRGQGLGGLNETDKTAFVNAYTTAALWSSTDPDTGEELDENFDADDISAGTQKQMEEDLDSFLKSYGGLVKRALTRPDYDYGQVAHDFWLTRNGHGAGFWDRGLGEIGDKLTEAVRPYGGMTLYAQNDETIGHM